MVSLWAGAGSSFGSSSLLIVDVGERRPKSANPRRPAHTAVDRHPSTPVNAIGKRVGCKPSGVRIPHPPPSVFPGIATIPGAFSFLVPTLPSTGGLARKGGGRPRPTRPKHLVGPRGTRGRRRPPDPAPGPGTWTRPAGLTAPHAWETCRIRPRECAGPPRPAPRGGRHPTPPRSPPP